MRTKAVVVCDRAQLNRLFSLLDQQHLSIEKIFTNVFAPAVYRSNGAEIACLPACDIDTLKPSDADLCINLRAHHGDAIDAQLAERGFHGGHRLDLDPPMLFRDSAGLLSAGRIIRAGGVSWRGFLTGLSYYRAGVLEETFDHQLLNIAGDSQDLHYDLAMAQHVLSSAARPFQYAVIGLAPYSLSYDLAESAESWRFIKYYPALRDDHGLGAGLPIGLDRIFNAAIHDQAADKAQEITQQTFSSLFTTSRLEYFGLQFALDARTKAAKWSHRTYPATEAQNSATLSRYVDLCLGAGLKVFIVTPPMTPLFQRAYSPDRLGEFRSRIEQECRKGGVHFREFYQEAGYGLDHFYDSDHLNTKGAQMFSVELRRWIEATLAA